MHDPMTVCWDIKLPLIGHIATIWHVDPETDGSDDSCGWSFPKLTKLQKSNLKHLAWCEAREPWFQRLRTEKNYRPAEAECLLRGAFITVGRVIRLPVTLQEASELAARFTHCSTDNFRSSLCHLPGYHTNFEKDTPEHREDCAMGLFCSIARVIVQMRRPWYRHPRWHFWHWRIQVQPVLHFKRWAFSRCYVCGKGFRYGESPVSNSWDGTGPLWFRSEKNVRHSKCMGDEFANQ